MVAGGFWLARSRAIAAAEITTRYNFQPAQRNVPLGLARGVYPGRVVWAHDPLAAHWTGHIESTTDQWWMDQSTDQPRVDAMLSSTLRQLTGAATDDQAWKTIFAYYNSRARGKVCNGYYSNRFMPSSCRRVEKIRASRDIFREGASTQLWEMSPFPKSSSRCRSKMISTLPQGEGGK